MTGTSVTDDHCRAVRDAAPRRERAARWFREPARRAVSSVYDERETRWSADVAFEIALAGLGRDPDLLLDVGCGDGRTLAAAAERLPAGRLAGVDPAPEAVAATRARLAGVARARCEHAGADAVGAAAGFPVGRPDLVLMHLCLGLVPDPREALVAVAEALAPGGLCYVVDLVRPDADGRAALLDTVHGDERDYLADQIDASLDGAEAAALVDAVAARVPGVTGWSAVGGLGGHPMASPAARAMWSGSGRLRELLRQPQAHAVLKSDSVVHLHLRRDGGAS